VAFGSAIVTILGHVRRMGEDGGFINKVLLVTNSGGIENQYYPSSFINNTKELAISVRCLNLAVDYVEQHGEHTYGLFAAQDVMLLLPTLKGTFISTFDVPRPLTSAAQLLTYYDLGPFATWGVGTTCVADVYLDFGIYGVVFCFLLFGFLSRKLEVYIISNDEIGNYILLAIAFSVFAHSIYIPRSTILYSLNKVFYISIFIFVVSYAQKVKYR